LRYFTLKRSDQWIFSVANRCTAAGNASQSLPANMKLTTR